MSNLMSQFTEKLDYKIFYFKYFNLYNTYVYVYYFTS